MADRTFLADRTLPADRTPWADWAPWRADSSAYPRWYQMLLDGSRMPSVTQKLQWMVQRFEG